MSTDVGANDEIETDFDDSHEFVLRRASRFLSHVYSRHLDSIGLTTPQFTILRRIDRGGPLTMADLAQWAMLDRSTLVRAIQVLKKNGYVQSSPARSSGRRTELSLTALGAERVAQARVLWRDAQCEFEAHFGAERAYRLRMELFDLTRYQPTDDPL